MFEPGEGFVEMDMADPTKRWAGRFEAGWLGVLQTGNRGSRKPSVAPRCRRIGREPLLLNLLPQGTA